MIGERVRQLRLTDKRLPDCEGIETGTGAGGRRQGWPDKRLPDCEGIETRSLTSAYQPSTYRQEAARL